MSTPPPPTAPSSNGCGHCDSSVPHEHLDVRAVVDGARSHARRASILQVLLAVGVLLLTAVLAGTDRLGPVAGAALVAAAGWAVVTALGVLVTGSLRRRRGDRGALLSGVLAAAAGIPIVALAVTLLTPGSGWAAPAAAGGWLLVTAGAHVVRARAWRRLLLEPGEAGEHARGRAVADRRAHHLAHDLLSWVLPALFLGLSVVLTGLLPALVVVLVPLGVVLAVARARSATTAG